MQKKSTVIIILSLVISIMFANVAVAHVTVQPRQSTQGSYEKFAVRVPTEKEIPTVKVEVRIPTDMVSISRFEPKPGWTYELVRDADQNISGVTWTATGAGLSATEFGEFYMQGKVADHATEIVWKAYQTYSDGSVVEWTGGAGSDTPASITTVVPSASSDQSEASGLPLYLSIAALVLAVVSLIVSLSAVRKKA